MTEPRCPRCGHPGVHHRRGDNGHCEDCDSCWADQQRRDRPPHHVAFAHQLVGRYAMTLTMTIAEREDFLAGLHVAVLSVDDPGHGPLTVPVRSSYAPGGTVNVVTGGQSVKARLLRAAGRFSSACRPTPCPIATSAWKDRSPRLDDTVSADERRALAHRYLGAEGGDLYVASTADQAAGSVALRMSPERWRTTDYGKLGEATTHTAVARTAMAPGRCAAVVQVHPNGPTGWPPRHHNRSARAGWPRLSGGHPAPKCVARRRCGAPPTALCSATPPSPGRDSTARRFLSIHSRSRSASAVPLRRLGVTGACARRAADLGKDGPGGRVARGGTP